MQLCTSYLINGGDNILLGHASGWSGSWSWKPLRNTFQNKSDQKMHSMYTVAGMKGRAMEMSVAKLVCEAVCWNIIMSPNVYCTMVEFTALVFLAEGR